MKTLMIAIAAITLFNTSLTANAAGQSTVVPANTVVPLILDQDLRSGHDHAGADIRYRTIADVRGADGAIVIPAGAIAHGVVKQSHGCAGFGKNGKLEITCDYVEAPDGTRIAFSDPDFKKGGKSQLVTMLFTPFVLMPFVKGKDVILHEGMVVTMAVATDTTVSEESLTPNTPRLDVRENGRHKKPFQGTIKSYTADQIVFATDNGDRDLPIKSIDSITLDQ